MTPHFGQVREPFFLGQLGLLRSCGEDVLLGPEGRFKDRWGEAWRRSKNGKKTKEQREEGSILDDEGAIFFERGEQATRGRFLRGEENELGEEKQRER